MAVHCRLVYHIICWTERITFWQAVLACGCRHGQGQSCLTADIHGWPVSSASLTLTLQRVLKQLNSRTNITQFKLTDAVSQARIYYRFT